MLAHVGMVGAALEGDVERDFDAEFAGALHQAAEILERAEFRMDRLVAALGARRWPRASPRRQANTADCC